MKSTYKFILAALAATAVLAACTKDPVPGKSDSDSAVTYRTITVSFDTPTKAILDGAKPKFQAGDTILLSDGAALDTCVVKVTTAGVAAIETKLVGKKLTAVYPMKAVRNTALNGNPDDIASEPLIPTKQSGRFSDANICTATTGEDGKTDKLQFKNVYPILRFYVDSTIAVRSIKIELAKASGAYIALDTAKTSDDEDRTIIVDAGELGTLDKVTGERVCYVAVRNQVPASGLTFTSETKTQGTVVRKSPSHYTLYTEFIYNAFIPYYIDVDGQKWGYCNVGAFYPEDKGEYFAWGETKGYKWDAIGQSFPELSEDGQLKTHYFNWASYQYNDHKESLDPGCISSAGHDRWPGGSLISEYDAAACAWKGNWRMPTKSETEFLLKVLTKADSTGVMAGKLKIPYSGFGLQNVLSNEKLETEGYIWTKTSEYNASACAFTFSCVNDGSVYKINTMEVSGKDLCLGYPIRPIYDETMSGGDAVSLQISPYTDGKTL